jgi:RNA polymerase sigma factor (TIGR02999 family)
MSLIVEKRMKTTAEQSKSDEQLYELINKWQYSPAKYTDLLLGQIYPTLLNICKKKESSVFNRDVVKATAESLVNEAYIKLRVHESQSEIDSVRTFYDLLNGVVMSVITDRYRKANAAKRQSINESIVFDKLMNGDTFTPDILKLDECLTKLKKIEPAVVEAFSLRLWNAKTIEQTARIMNISIATVERLLFEGKKMLTAILMGVEITA